MSRKNKKAILTAIKDSGGIISTIAKRLDVTWHTADNWIKEFEETKQALKDEENIILDMAESTIFKSIKDGSSQDAKWYLSTKGKHRGFGDKPEVSEEDAARKFAEIIVNTIGEK